MGAESNSTANGPRRYRYLRSSTDGGVASDHLPATESPALLAPASDKHHNAWRPGLFPIACWRLDDLRFGFDSSFLKPEAAKEFQALAALVRAHPGAPLTVFGHADPTGKEEYNKKLSGRRAMAVYALLTRNVGLWEEIYINPHGGDDWKTTAVHTILATLGWFENPGSYAAVDPLADAVYRFQLDAGLVADGDAGPNTRAVLFLRYMDALACDAYGQCFRLTPQDFLARGADAGGRGDYQGCGEFNPLVRFSAQEDQEFQKKEMEPLRNAENAPNRRVVILLFRPGSRVDPSRWPCPRALSGTGECKKRLWSDAADRRILREQHREHEETGDTFACRFYQRLSGRSPCERFGDRLMIRLFDGQASPVRQAPFLVQIGDKEVRGTADRDGWIVLREPEFPETCTIQWKRPENSVVAQPNGGLPKEQEGMEYQMEVNIAIHESNETRALDERLQNLGYVAGATLEQKLSEFRRDYPGILGSDIVNTVKQWHDNAGPQVRKPRPCDQYDASWWTENERD